MPWSRLPAARSSAKSGDLRLESERTPAAGCQVRSSQGCTLIASGLTKACELLLEISSDADDDDVVV